jgi:hypothetical protein
MGRSEWIFLSAGVALVNGSISVCHWLASVFEVGLLGITIDYL